MGKEIKNIIFDLGGVVLHIDPDASERAFKQLFTDDSGEVVFNSVIKSGLLQSFELGKFGTESFFNQIQHFTGSNISVHKLYQAWMAMILDFDPEKIRFIERLKNRYAVFLLSNTNEMHYAYLNQKFTNQFPYTSLDSLFHQAFYSFRMGCSKPDEKIFVKVLEETGIKAENTIFIDDAEANIKAAGKLHFRVWHHRMNDDFDVLENLFFSETFGH